MKGTLLDDLKADYEKINATIGAMDLNVCRISAEHQRVRKSYKEAKEKFEEARSNSVIEDELEGLRKMVSFN